MNPPQGLFPVQPQQLKNQIAFNEAKAQLKEIRLNAFRKRIDCEKKWLEDLAQANGMPHPRAYIDALSMQYSAEAELMAVDLNETRALIFICQEQLKEAECMVKKVLT